MSSVWRDRNAYRFEKDYVISDLDTLVYALASGRRQWDLAASLRWWPGQRSPEVNELQDRNYSVGSDHYPVKLEVAEEAKQREFIIGRAEWGGRSMFIWVLTPAGEAHYGKVIEGDRHREAAMKEIKVVAGDGDPGDEG